MRASLEDKLREMLFLVQLRHMEVKSIQFNSLLDKAQSIQCVIHKINKKKVIRERRKQQRLNNARKLQIELRFIRHYLWYSVDEYPDCLSAVGFL